MKKIIPIILSVVILLFSSCVYGAASISVNTSSVTVGNTVTVTVSFSGVGSWDATITPSGPVKEGAKQFVGDTGTGLNGTGSVSATYTTSSAGTVTFSLSGNTTSFDAATTTYPKQTLSGSKSVTVSSPVVTTPPTTTPTTTTGSNANLKKLVPNYEGLSPNFNPATTKYSLTVPASATKLGLTIGVEATGAKYWITGEDNLQMGDNTVTVTVTATDGTKKVYTIIVTKAADVAKANAYLNSIVIDGKTLTPGFTSENLEYDIGTVTSDIEKLTVLAFAQDENARVEVSGSDALIEGLNSIKIKVTAADGTTTKEYIVKVTKEAKALVEEEVVIYPETDSLQVDNTPSGFSKFIQSIGSFISINWLVLSLLIVSIFELGQIVYLYMKVEKFKKVKTLNSVNEINNNEDTSNDNGYVARRRNIEVEKENNISLQKMFKNSEEAIDDISDELVDDLEDISNDGEEDK